MWRDLRYGARLLARTPGFTLVAVLTLAVGIGANAAIFSVVNAVLLRPLPYRGADRIVTVHKYYAGQDEGTPTVSGPDFLDYRQRSRALEALAAITGGTVSLTGEGEPEQVPQASITAEFFPVFGVEPLLGRNLTPEEVRPNGPRVAVISHGLWLGRYGGRPELVGQTIQIAGNPFTVIGVLPADFRLHLPANAFLLRDADVWTPIQSNLAAAQRTDNFLTAFGRLKPGVTPAQAQAEMDEVAARLNEEHPELKADETRVRVLPLHRAVVGDSRPVLFVLLGAVGLLLLITCANVANLQLARAAARGRELAVRVSLGATRLRLARQMLTESLLLSLGGGAAGLLLARWGLDLLLALRPANLPRLESVSLDARVLGVSAAACMLTPLLFGLPAALRAAGVAPAAALGGGRVVSAADRKGLHRLLVVGQLALSLVLLAGAGLLLRTFASLQAVRLGFDPRDVLTLQVSPPYPRYGALGLDRNAAFFDQLEKRVAALPGVEAVGITSQAPLSGSGHLASYSWDDESRSRPGLEADWRFVTPGYFNAVGTKLLAGRFFTEADDARHPKVVIVDEPLARRAWPGENPVGKKLLLPDSTPRGIQRVWMEVVGVIEPVRSHRLTEHVREQFYIPYAQTPAVPNMILTVRTKAERAGLVQALAGEVRALDKEIPVYNVRPLEAYVSDALAPARFSLTLVAVFGAVALLLAAVGLYGLVSYWVGGRTREIGIRMALGARPRHILRMVLGQGLWLTLAGVALGLAAALGATRLIAGLLYGVSAADPLTYAAVAALLAGVSLLACLIPARRAARVDPLAAIRAE